jgi:8-oxo-dGTP pyrophosphatase MutT (NUDIX family)
MTDQEVTFKMDWVESENILEKDQTLPVTQVYGWVTTSDKMIALVSKNGTKWQFPGGHPEAGETLKQALTRELQEEIGLDISTLQVEPKLFGYYVVSEISGDVVNKQYVQTRFIVKIDKQSELITIAPQEKDTEAESERIRFAIWKQPNEACEMITWLKNSEEFKGFSKFS